MSEDVSVDNEDTISVPLPVKEEKAAEPEQADRLEQAVVELTDIRDAIDTLERTLSVTKVAFENLKLLLFGDGKAVVHAWPLPGVELTPCCGRKAIDLPLTERIALDPSEITCGKESG